VANVLDEIALPRKAVWDLGADVGTFSRNLSNRGTPTVSFGVDPVYLVTKSTEAR
jgi:hypothetical protein